MLFTERARERPFTTYNICFGAVFFAILRNHSVFRMVTVTLEWRLLLVCSCFNFFSQCYVLKVYPAYDSKPKETSFQILFRYIFIAFARAHEHSSLFRVQCWMITSRYATTKLKFCPRHKHTHSLAFIQTQPLDFLLRLFSLWVYFYYTLFSRILSNHSSSIYGIKR